jgi:CheY-like chemotaxis protein
MNPLPTILVADDDEGHAILIRENLEIAGLKNPIEHFRDGQAILDFLFERDGKTPRSRDGAFLVLLDIRMPKVDGVEVLRRIKANPVLKKLPVIMLTTTDDSREVERCHILGCNEYIQKPVDYDRFTKAIQRLGSFVGLMLIPPVRSL